MSKVWKIGVAGLGTVGGGLVKYLVEHPGFAPAGGKAVVTGVCARSRSRPRDFDIATFDWYDDPVLLAQSPQTDIFVELIGGSDGPAKVAVEAALALGKPVVTANKALIAEHGAELARLAEAHGAPLLFEAAVMGGTPAVKMLREAMVGDEVISVAGILNGTCNYILTEMESHERAFADVLGEAQAKGYAEADPTMDIGGFDAAHKITILAALAFGCAPNYAAAEIEGVERVELLDIRLARELGYRIRLTASAEKAGDGISVRVHPALAPIAHPLSQTVGGTGRGRGADGGRLLRRHRRCDDRRGAAGVPEASDPTEDAQTDRCGASHRAGLSAPYGAGRGRRPGGGDGGSGRGRRLDRQLPSKARRGRRTRAHRSDDARSG